MVPHFDTICGDPEEHIALCVTGWRTDYPEAGNLIQPFLAWSGYSPTMLGYTPQELAAWGYEPLEVPSVQADFERCAAMTGVPAAMCWARLDQLLVGTLAALVPIAFNQGIGDLGTRRDRVFVRPGVHRTVARPDRRRGRVGRPDTSHPPRDDRTPGSSSTSPPTCVDRCCDRRRSGVRTDAWPRPSRTRRPTRTRRQRRRTVRACGRGLGGTPSVWLIGLVVVVALGALWGSFNCGPRRLRATTDVAAVPAPTVVAEAPSRPDQLGNMAATSAWNSTHGSRPARRRSPASGAGPPGVNSSSIRRQACRAGT